MNQLRTQLLLLLFIVVVLLLGLLEVKSQDS